MVTGGSWLLRSGGERRCTGRCISGRNISLRCRWRLFLSLLVLLLCMMRQSGQWRLKWTGCGSRNVSRFSNMLEIWCKIGIRVMFGSNYWDGVRLSGFDYAFWGDFGPSSVSCWLYRIDWGWWGKLMLWWWYLVRRNCDKSRSRHLSLVYIHFDRLDFDSRNASEDPSCGRSPSNEYWWEQCQWLVKPLKCLQAQGCIVLLTRDNRTLCCNEDYLLSRTPRSDNYHSSIYQSRRTNRKRKCRQHRNSVSDQRHTRPTLITDWISARSWDVFTVQKKKHTRQAKAHKGTWMWDKSKVSERGKVSPHSKNDFIAVDSISYELVYIMQDKAVASRSRHLNTINHWMPIIQSLCNHLTFFP